VRPRRRERPAPEARSATKPRETINELLGQIEAELSGPRSRAAFGRLRAALVETARGGGSAEKEEGVGDAPGLAGGYWDGSGAEVDRNDEEDGDDDDDDIGLRDGPYLWGGRRFYSPSVPRPVEGGIAARSQRGHIGESWWSKRFLEAVEPYLVGGRSGRGRSYARKGQVLELSVGPGLISALVQGSRPKPYKTRIAMAALSDAQWERVLGRLSSQAGYSALMLGGELPHEVEEVFAAEGCPLLPSRTARLVSDCSCPDWANPCKHVAAVCYLVAEEYDRDPFALLAWRGRDREQVLSRLRELRGGEVAAEIVASDGPGLTAPALRECVLGFWKAGPELASVQLRPVASLGAGAVLRQLPKGLVEVRGRDLGEVLVPAYEEMAAAAERRAVGG
jgi:uncharacterized Zn finger protein